MGGQNSGKGGQKSSTDHLSPLKAIKCVSSNWTSGFFQVIDEVLNNMDDVERMTIYLGQMGREHQVPIQLTLVALQITLVTKISFQAIVF